MAIVTSTEETQTNEQRKRNIEADRSEYQRFAKEKGKEGVPRGSRRLINRWINRHQEIWAEGLGERDGQLSDLTGEILF